MVESISSSPIVAQMTQKADSSSSSLTASQLEIISSVLEEYDADNLSESDAQSIISAFEEAGIEPSAELESAMEEAGFSAQEVGSLGNAQGDQAGMPPPPPPPSEEEVSSISSLLDTLLSTEEDDESDALTSFDDIMDYTSKILNLNEESKTEVIDLLNKYSSEDNDYSQEETNALIKNSLSQILSDSNNYNPVSFYG